MILPVAGIAGAPEGESDSGEAGIWSLLLPIKVFLSGVMSFSEQNKNSLEIFI